MGSLVDSLLFKPPATPSHTHPSRRFWITTSTNSRIPATFIKRPGANVTLLFSHGNAEDLTSAYSFLRRLSRQLDVNVMAYDYTGYGESKGTPTEKNCYADIEAAFRYLVEERKIYPEQIVLYGRSLGSGPSCFLASKTADQGRSVAGLILHSPFTSVYRVVVNVGFTMVGDRFPNIDRAPTLRCPVFIVHGREDEVVPIEHGTALYNALPSECRAEPYWVEGMGHNDLKGRDEQTLMERLNYFLDYHILSRRLWAIPSSSKCTTSNHTLDKNSSVLPEPSKACLREIRAVRREREK